LIAAPQHDPAFVNELNTLGADLKSGNLTASQQDLLSLDSTALGAATPATTVSAPTDSTGSTASTNPSDIQALIKAIVQAIGSGDTSAASSDLAQLASVSGSSQGATYLNSLSTSLASGSSTNSISQLLQSLNTSGSSGSSLLNELA